MPTGCFFQTSRLPAGALVFAALAGCGEEAAVAGAETASAPARRVDWAIYRGDSALRGVAPGRLSARLELAWTHETGEAIVSSPVVVGDTVYVGSSTGSIYALERSSGEARWTFATDDIVDAPPLVLEGRVYVGSSDFFFYALDAASGELVWKYETGDRILGGANWVRMDDGAIRIVVGSYDNCLHCFDVSGQKLWSYETDNYVNGTPAVWGQNVVFGGCDAVLHVVSVATGKSVDRIELGADCHVAGSVAIDDGRAYFGHYGNAFVCADLERAEPVWVYPGKQDPFFSSPAIGADRVVFGGRDKKLHCVERATGEPVWTFPTRRKIDSSPVLCGDKVVFGSGDGRLYIVDLESGRELWKYEIGRPVFSSPAVCDGMVVVGANDGRVYAFQAAQ